MQLGFYHSSHCMAEYDVWKCTLYLFDKLEFGGQWPLTIRTWCGTIRYCPDPLGIVTAEQFDKLEFMEQNTPKLNDIFPVPELSRNRLRAYCEAERESPHPAQDMPHPVHRQSQRGHWAV